MRIQIKKNFKVLYFGALLAITNFSYAACSINSTSFAFGAYNPLSGQSKTSSAMILVSCTEDRTLIMTLSSGNSGVFSPRRMLNGSQKINYNLYLDSSFNNIFGDGTSGTNLYKGIVGTSLVSIPVYGLIPANQNVSVGQYNDLINITLFF